MYALWPACVRGGAGILLLVDIMSNMAYLDKLRNVAEDAYGTARGMRDETERKVFEALNNKNWGASSTTLAEIARETFSYDKFGKIFRLIWEAADSAPRNWRKVFKALMLCEYLVKNGCERCVDEVRDHGYRVRQLQDFQYMEDRIDRGQGVRDKAKQLLELLSDNANIREARDAAKRLRDKFANQGAPRFGGYGNSIPGGPNPYPGGSSNISSYTDNGTYGPSGGYSDGGIDKPSDAAQGRYADGSAAARQPPLRAADDIGAGGGFNLKLKPKAKAVPRLKMKGADTGVSAAADDKPEEDLFAAGATTADPSAAAQPQADLFDAFASDADDSAPPRPTFDPRANDFAAFDLPPEQPLQQQPPAFTADFGNAFGQQPPLHPASYASADLGPSMTQPSQPPMHTPIASGMTPMMSGSAPPAMMGSAMPPMMMGSPPASVPAGNSSMMNRGNMPTPIMGAAPSMMGGVPAMGGAATMMGGGAAPPPARPQPADDTFGDFDAAPAVEEHVAKSPADAIAEAGDNLVSLDSLSLNASAKAPAPASAGNRSNFAQHAAFTGLDGFNTSPQPTMIGGTAAYSQYGQPSMAMPQAMGQHMASQPSAMNPQPMQPGMQQQMRPTQAHVMGQYPPQPPFGVGYPQQQQAGGTQPYAPPQAAMGGGYGMPGPAW